MDRFITYENTLSKVVTFDCFEEFRVIFTTRDISILTRYYPDIVLEDELIRQINAKLEESWDHYQFQKEFGKDYLLTTSGREQLIHTVEYATIQTILNYDNSNEFNLALLLNPKFHNYYRTAIFSIRELDPILKQLIRKKDDHLYNKLYLMLETDLDDNVNLLDVSSSVAEAYITKYPTYDQIVLFLLYFIDNDDILRSYYFQITEELDRVFLIPSLTNKRLLAEFLLFEKEAFIRQHIKARLHELDA